MAKHKLWTASVPVSSKVVRAVTLHAQCKSSKSELMRRLIADDPIWKKASVTLHIAPRFPNRYFRRGLGMKATYDDA